EPALRFRRDDGECPGWRPSAWLPAFVQAREQEQTTIAPVKPVRPPALPVPLPLVETVRGHDAPPLFECGAERRALSQRLGAGVERLRRVLRVPDPVVQQPPARG